MNSITFKPSIDDLECPCGGKVRVGTADNLPQTDFLDVPCVMHSQPSCEDFKRLEVVDFMRFIRKHLEAQEAGADA